MTREEPLSDASLLTLRQVRRMLEGVIPPALCSVSPDGVPHVAYLSQAEYVDDEHIALSFQFFNRSRRNVLATRRAALSVEDPYTGGAVMMQLDYLRTDTAGPVFERLRAKLAGIASQTGMEKVFRLQGADVYRVREVRRVAGRRELPAAEPRCDVAAGGRAIAERIARCTELDELVDGVMAGVRDELRIGHAMLLLVDREQEVFYTMASLGYAVSGVGAELPLAHGLAGVAVREGVALRVGHMTTMTLYGRAARERTEALGLHGVLDDEIPLPGLARPRSQLAVPLRAAGQTLGALLVESEQDQFFSYDDEDALTMVACHLASAMLLLRGGAQTGAEAPAAAGRPGDGSTPQGSALRVRRHVRDHSVWFDDDYVIKGVAGAILWKLLDDWHHSQRTQFSNRELRQASGLGLPEVQDNLEVRLLLLQRRLDERAGPVRIVKEGRGRWRLDVHRPVVLQSVDA
jgi:adenylate cyclase